MTDKNVQYLDTFPAWLKSLGEDVSQLATVLRDDSLPEGARRLVAGSINYLFKSLDLIPDGIEDLGFIDDAFVLRVAAALAVADARKSPESERVLRRLGGESKLVADFLGPEYPRLEVYVRGLTKGAARGRTVDEILSNAEVKDALISEIHGWVQSYEAPGFNRDDRTLVKLKSFLDTKLPR